MAKNSEVPLWHRYALTITEAAKVFGIGEKQIRQMIQAPGCPYVMYVGRKKNRRVYQPSGMRLLYGKRS